MASDLYTYDLDSLAFMSTTIFEGEITSSTKSTFHVKPSAVYIGACKQGDDLEVFGTSFYLWDEKGRRFSAGDKVILFLKDASRGRFDEYPPHSLTPVPSGIKLIIGDKIAGFMQLDNPGPYVAMLPDSMYKPVCPLVKDFQTQIQNSIAFSNVWKTRFERPATVDEIPQLLDGLRDRVKTRSRRYERDAVAQEIAVRLANLHEPESLCSAICIDSWQLDISGCGLGTPEGRELLLKKLADSTISPQERLNFVGALRYAGGRYASRNTDIQAGSWGGENNLSPKNTLFVTRLAKVARDLATESELSASLVRELRSLIAMFGDRRPTELQQDLDEAVVVLKEFYKESSSERLRFEIECTLDAIDATARAQISAKSDCVIGIVEDEPSPNFAHVPGMLSMRYTIVGSKGSKELMLSSDLIFQDTNTKHESKTPIGSWGNEGDTQGSQLVALPANLPRGRHRIFVRFSKGEKQLGESYGFEKNLP